MNESEYKERLRELERELAAKEAQIALLHQRLDTTNSRLEKVIQEIAHEVKLAGRIQKLMSPVEIPHIQGFEFSTKFVPSLKSGGDYFDIFEHMDRLRFGIVLSASSGYTMSALFLSALLKISGKMQARHGLEPEQMVQTIFSELKNDLKDGQKASLFYGVVDRRNFDIKFCLVGGVGVFLQKAGQEAVQRLKDQGPAIDASFNTQPQSVSLALNARDRLVICSDGVMAATNAAGKAFGEAGVLEAIRSAPRQGVHELRNEILFRCEGHAGKAAVDRDQTVIVLEVKDKVLKLAKN